LLKAQKYFSLFYCKFLSQEKFKKEKEMDLDIQYDESAQKFFVIIDDEEALLEYYHRDDKTLVFNHTFVPTNLRGKGIAATLTRYALNYAREHNFKVIPQCSYVVEYVEKNKEFNDIITESME
jgi:uncharacterized protein